MEPKENNIPETCDGRDDNCDGAVDDGFFIVEEPCDRVPSDPCDGPGSDHDSDGTPPPDTVEPKDSPVIGEPCDCDCDGDGVDVDCDGTVDNLCSITKESCDDVDGDTCDNCPN